MDCSHPVQVRCGCRRLTEQLPCREINTIKNYRLPCDEACVELKKNRNVSEPVSAAPAAPVIVEETKTPVETDSPVNARKNRKRVNPTADTSPALSATPRANASSTKKVKPRRFVWTFNTVVLLFAVFIFVTVSSIVYMLKQISWTQRWSDFLLWTTNKTYRCRITFRRFPPTIFSMIYLTESVLSTCPREP